MRGAPGAGKRIMLIAAINGAQVRKDERRAALTDKRPPGLCTWREGGYATSI